MKSKILEVRNLHATVNDIEVLNGINLIINTGEIHAIMGPNGSGKSTFSKVLAGHPAYKVTEGEIFFKGENICETQPDVRANKGLFLAFQYPVEIPGVNNYDFLYLAASSKEESLYENETADQRHSREKDNPPMWNIVENRLEKNLELVGFDPEFLQRNLNEGFSGGEKKINEILQFAVLDADLGILDEIDSGLDIDALRKISGVLTKILTENKNKSIILITHYKRLLDYIKPDFIHVMRDGKIIKTADSNFATILEEKGYDWLA